MYIRSRVNLQIFIHSFMKTKSLRSIHLSLLHVFTVIFHYMTPARSEMTDTML